MYGCESWTVKKAEHRRIDEFELWCWRRLLRVPWTARRSNQSILKEISPGCSSEGMMLKLKLQYFSYLMRRVDSLEKTLMLGGIVGRFFTFWVTREAPLKASDKIRSVAQSCPTLCDHMNRSTPGHPVHHHLSEFTPTHVHRVGDAIQPSHPLSFPSPPAPNPSQHQGLFQ